jgi:hypothetical protein
MIAGSSVISKRMIAGPFGNKYMNDCGALL